MMGEFLGSKKSSSILFVSNKKGQFAIEAVLLMTILIGAFLVLTKTAREKAWMAQLVSKPMTRVATMSGYGTWQEKCLGQGKSTSQSLGKCHPNSIHRSLSSDPK